MTQGHREAPEDSAGKGSPQTRRRAWVLSGRQETMPGDNANVGWPEAASLPPPAPMDEEEAAMSERGFGGSQVTVRVTDNFRETGMQSL